MTTFLHLAYLQQVSDLLEDQHKPLAARLGFIAKKISAKHLVHINGADVPKLRKCKACQAPITCQDIRLSKGKILVSCSLCEHQRSYSASKSKLAAAAAASRKPVEGAAAAHAAGASTT